MNFKVFSIIVGVLIIIIGILSGTYFYLFEYSKPKSHTLNSDTYSEEHHSYSKDFNNSYSSTNIINNATSYDSNITYNQNISSLKDNDKQDNNITIKDNKQNLENDNNISTIKNGQIFEDKNNLEQTQMKTLTKETNKTEKIFKKETLQKKELQANKTKKIKKLNPAQEYLTLGKDSRLEPKLSTENMKVYILDGKFLSRYRINLLKDMLNIIDKNSKDHRLSVFVKMLPKGEMKLTIYNKEIIFSNMKQAYKYVRLEQLSPYLNNPKELAQHLEREEIVERVRFKIKKSGQGSEFYKHIKSLKTGLNTAQYFFPFCEIIEITTT
ncbi:hypothetical protein N4T57_05035 [Campylobacter hepaticus]|uniref:Periplasmic protein n=1 Tax=Campylobacter hepaticus TaxID=1813019 RepID=A0A6A7JR47_9BACT|nr:hypothetical protein [Campylobacter hepaticus]AXP08667.1 hypothetical protein A2J15_002865 [Campylobacter hepaticus]MCZ0772511.1 hypothetical protein [Campylobacter hepaticus]MCZ0773979.1 hypothetical protein [Campylobacter hepaticus]MCZ0775231.1 hypothetical protein [Campylobacter hepaticus]MDX2323268.1 hypothetical protein [Campylobacter hepaticus]